MIKPTSLYLIYTLLCGVGTVASGSQPRYDGLTDESKFMFYDATEQCKKNGTAPCITNLHHCSKDKHSDPAVKCPEGAKEDKELSWLSDSDVRFVEVDQAPIPLIDFYGDSWIDVQWVNTNPKYPTVVTWWPSPAFSNNLFYLYKVIPAGEMHANISIGSPGEIDMLPRSFVASNASNDEFYFGSLEYYHLDQLITSVERSLPIVFGIGQPEDPEFKAKHLSGYQQNENISATPSLFFHSNIQTDSRFYTQEDTREYIKWLSHRTSKRWSIGVGVGVGVGVPLVAILAFWVGKCYGRRSVPFQQKKATGAQSTPP